MNRRMFHIPRIQWKEEFNHIFCRTGEVESIPSKRRIEYIDLAKGICIMLVVFHHIALQDHDLEYPLKNMLKMFRMPLYFTLSGLFFKSYSGFFEFALRKIDRLLIPYFTFYLLAIVISDTNGAIWFLFCLFIINMLFYGLYLLSQIKSSRHHVFILCLITLAFGIIGYFLSINNINLPIYIDTALTALPFFAAGYVMRKYTDILLKKRYDGYLWIVCVVLFVLCWLLAGYVNYRTNTYQIDPFSLYLGGFCGIMGVLFLAKSLVKIPILSYCGRYSIIILLTHIPILHMFWRPTLKWLLSCGFSHIAAVILFTLVIMLCYIIIIPIVKTYLPHVTAQKDVFSLLKTSKNK